MSPVSSAASVSTPVKDFTHINFDTSTFAARLTLNHPPYNVLTVPLMTEIAQAIESLNGRADIKCILLESSQKAFCEDSSRMHLMSGRPLRLSMACAISVISGTVSTL